MCMFDSTRLGVLVVGMYDEYDEDDTYFVGRPNRWGSPSFERPDADNAVASSSFYIHHNYEGTDDDEEENDDDADDNAVAVLLYPS